MVSFRQALKLEKGGVISIVGAGGKTSLMFGIARELAGAGESVLATTTTHILRPSKDQSANFLLAHSPEEIVERAKELPENDRSLCAAMQEVESKGKVRGLPRQWIDELDGCGVFSWIIVEADGAAGKPLKAPAGHEPVIAQKTKWLISVIGLDAIEKPFGEEWVFRSELFQDLTGLTEGAPITPEAITAAVQHEKGLLKDCPSQASRILFLNKADLDGGVDKGRRIIACLRKEREIRPLRVIIGKALEAVPILEYADLSSP